MSRVNTVRVQSINAGRLRNLASDGKVVCSGIDKRPCADGARIECGGVQADQIADPRYHGGPDQAVYIYSANDYDWWSGELKRRLPAGIFGENLTIDGLPTELNIGDRLIGGTVELEITGPRIPCHKLGLVMEDASFPQRFRLAERPGAYCRVLSAGTLRPGDALTHEPAHGASLSIREMFRLYYTKPSPRNDLRKALATPLASRLREKFQARLDCEPSA